MVVCAEPLAAQVGGEILRRGGNAMDAAVATAFAQGVTDPIMCGVGGKGVMTIYWAQTGQMNNIRFWGKAGAKALPDVYASGLSGTNRAR